MAFQKYQGEQVNQIPAGYVEAMGSMGKAYQQVGASVSAGMQEAQKRSDEEAKLQGSLSPYLRRDGRTQAVESALSTGLLKKDEQGNVIIPDDNKNKFDMNVAGPAIEFYNKTGGDGSRLSGSDLTRLATQFEAQRKYDAEQAGIADKAMERAKTQAEINKLNAEAAEKTAGATGNNIVSAFASGAPMPAGEPASVPSSAPAVTASRNQAISIYSGKTGNELPSLGSPVYEGTPGFTKPLTGFSADRYNAGSELAGKLGTADSETPKPVAQTTTQATTALPAVTPSTIGDGQGNASEIIKAQEAERTVQTTEYGKKKAAAQGDYARAMAALASSGAATPERIKSLNETHKVKTDNIDSSFKANIDLIDSRIKNALATTSEQRATAGETRANATAVLAEKADVRSEEQLKFARAAAQRAVEEGRMTKEKFDLEFGTATTDSKPAVPVESANLKPGTFAHSQAKEREVASAVPGRTGGAYSREQEDKIAAKQDKMKAEFPANWSLGIFHEGAKQYQIDLNRHPTARALGAAAIGKVEEHMSGYSEAQTFLTALNDVVFSTDDNAITNYLNRSLWTAKQDAKDTNVEGQMMNQFGVAAFRRAIVSGGNFSDADREYVAKLITDINSAHLKKDKQLMIDQTKSLARFIDSKYRSELTAYGVRVDTKTSREFLTREGDQAGLAQLAKTEQYMRTFNLGGETSPMANRADYVKTMKSTIEKAKTAGNKEVVKQLQTQLDSHLADLDRKAAVAEAAKKNANK